MHFIQIKPTETKGKPVVPLLLLHGWPGSVREFYDFIPLLQQQNDKLDVVFEIIAPSLPGYGWSDGTTKTGLSPVKMSVVLRNLMLRLGHEKFYIQCGDWGMWSAACAISIIAPIFNRSDQLQVQYWAVTLPPFSHRTCWATIQICAISCR